VRRPARFLPCLPFPDLDLACFSAIGFPFTPTHQGMSRHQEIRRLSRRTQHEAASGQHPPLFHVGRATSWPLHGPYNRHRERRRPSLQPRCQRLPLGPCPYPRETATHRHSGSAKVRGSLKSAASHRCKSARHRRALSVHRVGHAANRTTSPVPSEARGSTRDRATGLRQELVTRDELMAQLRKQGIEDVGQVKDAWIEADGSVSVIRRRSGRSSALLTPLTGAATRRRAVWH
jgi:hypothetical protein